MVAIHWKRTTLDAINDNDQVQKTRPYMGISTLGHNCDRYLWYTFRWCYTDIVKARMRRLFDRGHREEDAVYNLLGNVGIQVHSKQIEAVLCYGHIKGHGDGIAIGVIEAPKTDHLLEIKTMNDANFKKLCKDGLKKSKPTYYCQAQCYATEFKLSRILFWATNKNDDHIYIERLETDKSYAGDMMRRGESIILSEEPGTRINSNPNWYECKWCTAWGICHNNEPVNKSCRVCKHGDIVQGGWECGFYGGKLTVDNQRKGCKEGYKLLECLEVK